LIKLNVDDVNRFMGRYSLGRDSNPLNSTDSPHFLRIKVPGGFLDSKQLRRIADLTKTYSRGQAEITNRQDLQLHWIDAKDALEIFSVMDELGFTTDMCGQGFSGARYGDARNIVCCPVSGIEKDELLNGTSLLKELSDFFIGNPDFQDMPRKFKFSISGCGSDCTRAITNDLSFVGVKKDSDVGFTLLVGGSMGASLPGPRLATPTGVFVQTEDAFNVAVATIEIHRDYGSRESKAKARFKWLLHNWGLKKFLSILEEKVGKHLEPYDGPIFLRNGEHEKLQPQNQEGYSYMNIPRIGGFLSSDEMSSLADLAEEYGSGDLRLTPTQNIIIPNVKEKDLLIKVLEEQEIPIYGSNLRWNSMGCASDFCGKTTTIHAKEVYREVVDHLEKHFDNELLNEAGFRIYVSGCPNNCCANLIAEIGLAGKLTKEKGIMKQHYDILLGGGLGTKPTMGRTVEENVPIYKLKLKIESLLTIYFEKRKTSESLKEFCNRTTKEELRLYLNSKGE
jgi:sulfite reductase beta subunit-like hemoprotein